MKMILLPSGVMLSGIGYSELPRRSDPACVQAGADSLFYSPERRADLLREALESGVSTALLTHERDVLSFREACRAGGIDPGQFTIATTDGAILERIDGGEEDAYRAVSQSIERKLQMLGLPTVDVFALHDIRCSLHTPAVLVGAGRALREAAGSGRIRAAALTSFQEHDFAAEIVRGAELPVELVIAGYNALDRTAADALIPACVEHGVAFYAVQTYAWVAGVPFTRFPNTWRLRNMTQNFFGMSAGQAHLRWMLNQPGIAGAFIGMDDPGQASINSAVCGESGEPLAPPDSVEALLGEFAQAIMQSAEGWTGLLQDERWEFRYAAERVLEANGLRYG